MKNEIKLSSDWTNVRLYGGSFALLFTIPLFFIVIESQEFHIGMAFGGLLFLAVFGFLWYQFVYVCDARKIKDKIVLKK